MILDILDVEFCSSARTFHLTMFSLVDVLDIKACQGRANIWDTCVWKNERNNGNHMYEQIGVHKHSHTLLISLLMQDDATWCKTRKLKHGPWRGQAFHHQSWPGRSYSNVASKALRNDMALWHFQFWRQVTSRETWAYGPCLTQIRKSMGVPHNDVKVSVTSVTSASWTLSNREQQLSNNSTTTLKFKRKWCSELAAPSVACAAEWCFELPGPSARRRSLLPEAMEAMEAMSVQLPCRCTCCTDLYSGAAELRWSRVRSSKIHPVAVSNLTNWKVSSGSSGSGGSGGIEEYWCWTSTAHEYSWILTPDSSPWPTVCCSNL